MIRPEHAVAIRAFDYFAAASYGAVAALASWLLVPDVLPTPIAMIAGMVVGMAAAFPLLGLLSVLLAGLEVVMMSMQIGMFAGMVGAMLGAGPTALAAGAGVTTGLVVQLLLHVADRSLHGEVSPLD